MKLKMFIMTLFSAMLLQSCQKHWAEMSMEFEAACWNAEDTLSISFESMDTSQVYQLEFPLEVTEDYPFSNIYIHAILVSPSGDESRIPSSFELCSNAGLWYSKPEGDMIPFHLKISDGLRFNQQGTYQLKMFHYMRDNQICGVQKAGIALDKISAKQSD